MPPVRTGSNTKSVKYERTHEENQERSALAVFTEAILWADQKKSLHRCISSKRPWSRSTHGVRTACVGASRKTHWSSSEDHRSRCHQRRDVRRDQRLTNRVSSFERASSHPKRRIRSQTPSISFMPNGNATSSLNLLAE
jgi:hypothetical protein